MRIAFFGGTFDPIHNGHLRIAGAAADAFGLDRVLFAPVGDQPLKITATFASYAERLEMVRLAVGGSANEGGDARFVASELDAPRPDGLPNFTVDTLETMRLEDAAAELFVIVGADSFRDLRRWKAPDKLLMMARWIVVSRPDVAMGEEEVASVALSGDERARVSLLTNVHEDISATELRRRLAAREPCESLLPTAVRSYIERHGLYR